MYLKLACILCGLCLSSCLGDYPRQIEWITIEGGTFSMYESEGTTTVATFQIMKTEVTNAQYDACVGAGGCTEPDSDCDEVFFEDDHPVTCISYNQLNDFAKWVGGRLPTEAEWEYAARSRGKDVTYPWGNEEPDCSLVTYDECEDGTSPVCSKERGNTEQGICDMAGNAAEWVEGSVLRGGGWDRVSAGSLRVAYRRDYHPSSQYGRSGGRVSRSLD